MFINRNTRILTDDPCDTCKGSGETPVPKSHPSKLVQDASPMEKCGRCKGTGRKLISISELVAFIEQEQGRDWRRQGIHPTS